MSKQKVSLPDSLKVGDKIRLIDYSWSILFPLYWASYREHASAINVATVVVDAVNESNKYTLGIIDIVPDEGRVHLPVGLKIIVDLETIHLSMALNYKLMKEL